MNELAIISPLLRSISHAAGEQGGFNFPAHRSGAYESISMPYFPELEFGLLSRDVKLDCWHQYEPSKEAENLMLDADSRGHVQIRTGDDDNVFLETTLRSGDELDELLDFYEHARAVKIGKSAIVRRLLSSMLDGVFLFVPDNGGELLEFDGPRIVENCPEFAEFVDYEFDWRWRKIVDLGGYPDLKVILSRCESKDGKPRIQALQPGDLAFDGTGSVFFPGMIREGAYSQFGNAPTLVLRLRQEISRMWFTDYLEHAVEAEGLLTGLLKNWRGVPPNLKEIQVEIPSSKIDQIARSIAVRESLMSYRSRIRQLTAQREPFGSIVPLYKKRIAGIAAVHNDLLEEISAIQNPLPFFIEYPYRCYLREGDPVRKERAGQRLLGIFVKVPLFLATEELMASGNELGASILATLEERPLSDGALVDLHRSLATKLGEGSEACLRVFSGLVQFFRDSNGLLELVQARNRMHHEPYDREGFLKALDSIAPQIVHRLRMALGECRFIVPLHSRVSQEGQKTVTAEDVCCSDALFRTVALNVSLPLESFPSNTMLAWVPDPERSIILGKLLTSTMVAQQTRDFGIFDRIQKNQRHFVFLRSD